MQFQFDVAASAAPASPPADATDLLRQLLEVQREHLALLRHLIASQDAGARWRAMLSRWQGDFADLPTACKQVLPQLERAYIRLIAELTDSLRQQGDDPLEGDFTLGEFLDRYGFRLAQLGTLLSLVGPLADLAPSKDQ